MNTLTNTERPKLKLNLAKPVMPTINSSSLASRKVVVLEKPKKTVNKDTSLDTAKVQNKQNLKNDANTKNEDTLAKKQPISKDDAKQSREKTSPPKNKVVVNTEEIIKAKTKRHKKGFQTILAKLQADYPECFSKEIKLLAYLDSS